MRLLKASGSVFLLLLITSAMQVQAQERLCDSANEDCRARLWALIDAETVGIDVAFWFMQDDSYATKLVNRFRAGRRAIEDQARLRLCASVLRQSAGNAIRQFLLIEPHALHLSFA